MGIFNQQPNYNQSKGKPIRGIQGPPGIGFNLTSDGNYDMTNKIYQIWLKELFPVMP